MSRAAGDAHDTAQTPLNECPGIALDPDPDAAVSAIGYYLA